MELELTPVADGLRFLVFAKPRASRSRVLGVKQGALEVAIAAPPVDGAANTELLKTLAKSLGVSKSSVVLVAGETSKHKRVVVQGLSADELRRRLMG
ncbi:MAG: DUF167 domain-containing protein [Polyangiaceae bacterium]|nr:DUF167 domain-containing protein [Myxococcales bacterium]MCB9585413.1 DUF167 domain-containing protein [Polyangiaceae bacterium]MCB9606571.1 DUF167 domain-containing protein [Polyangiaceae bacterium]